MSSKSKIDFYIEICSKGDFYMNASRDTLDPYEKALEIYNSSVNQSTATQQQCVNQLKNIYEQFPVDDVANVYAKSLFNLSLRVSKKNMQKISVTLEKLFQNHATTDIAERIGRLKFNLSTDASFDVPTLKRCAAEIEALYRKYQTDALAEPLAKIWCHILFSRAKDRLKYAEKIMDLCSNTSDPETHTAYARVLFNSEIPIENRDALIRKFLSKPQTLDSLCVYVESCYYPQYNKLFGEFWLSSSYPGEFIGKRINSYLSKLKKRANYDDLKVEILALLYYTFRIRTLLMVHDISVPIGHYTKIENLKHLMPLESSGGKLRMSNACYMNDPSEGQFFIKYLSSQIQDFSGLCDNLSYNIYLFCCTTAIDELPMWSMYGNDGKGCCLIFKKDFFDFTMETFSDELTVEHYDAEENNFLFRVVYISPETDEITISIFPEDEKYLNEEIKNAIGGFGFHLNKVCQMQNKNKDKIVNDILSFIFGQIQYLFKDISYAHEQELRLIRYSESPLVDHEAWIVPQLFVEVKRPLVYEKIILGPKVEQTNRIIPYLVHTGHVEEIKKSKIEYR